MRIKFGFRHNLIYLLMLIIFNFCRQIFSIIIEDLFEESLLFILIMFLGEFIAGGILTYYQSSFIFKNRNNSYMGIKLINAPSDIRNPDSKTKIYLLLFMASFFDFIGFTISRFYLPKYLEDSKTLEMRLSSILIILSALFFIFLLKLEILKHQIFALLITGMCLIVIIVMEFYFQINKNNKTFIEFLKILGLIFCGHFFNSLLDSSEKYLLEYDFLNPFKTLMIEGFFGTILISIYISIYFIYNEPFKEIKKYYNDDDETSKLEKIIWLILIFILYLILNSGRNVYRVQTLTDPSQILSIKAKDTLTKHDMA